MQEVFKYQDSFKMYTFHNGTGYYLYSEIYPILKDANIKIQKVKEPPRYYDTVERIIDKAIFVINGKKIVYDCKFGYLLQYNNNFYVYEEKRAKCKKLKKL